MDKFKKSNLYRENPFILLNLTLILACFPISPVSAGGTFPLSYITPKLDQEILLAESLVMERRYDDAWMVFDQIEMSESESLLPSMGRLLILMMQFLERGQTDRDLENLFQEEFKKNRRILKRMEKQKNLDVWDHFLLGGSLGVQGLYELEHKSYWSAFIHGLSALSHLKEVQRLNPEVYDVYFSHGVYKYFRSVKMRYLWFLPLIRDQRKEGIEEIHVALDKGHYSVPACKIAVVILAEREKEDEHGLVLGEKYLKEFPRSLLIRKALAEIYERNDRGLDAARIYRDAYHEDPSIRWVLLKAGQGFYHHRVWEQAEESFHTYLASDPPPPGSAAARAGLSNIYRSRGDMKRAREEWERAVLLDPVWNKREPEELQER